MMNARFSFFSLSKQIRFKFKDEFDHPLHESNGGGSDVKVETFVSEKENDNCSEFGDGDDSEDDLDPEKNILVDRTNLLFGKKPIRTFFCER